MATDDNGLYYMRNRYYNPDIKRFINQDILTGSIGNSASLNRYSYVEGNPVSYTDPFGLSPYGNFGTFLNVMNALSKLDKSAIIHTALDMLGAMPGGSWFDMANAALYFIEGNKDEGLKALLYALPGADIAGKGSKLAAWLGGNGKEFIEAVAKGIDLGTHFLAICQSASDFGTAAANMIDKYMVNEAELSWQTAVELFVLVGTGYQLGAFSKSYLDKVYSMFDMKAFSSSSTDLTKPVTNDKDVADDINYRDNVNTNSSTQDNSYTNSQAHQACMGDNLCFVAGTEIKTDEGYKNIEDIHAGDLVYAKNTETGEEGYKEVVRVFVKESDELIYLTIGDKEITTTPSHPFYVVDKGFVEAVELEIGDEVETADGERLFVTDIRYEYLDVPVTVYNFEVADWHTYYVSDEDVLVHNSCSTGSSDINALNGLPANKGYDSFGELKKAIGSPGEGNHWHHIVEQSQIKKSGFSTQQINNTNNIIAVDSATHAKITGYYNTKSFEFTKGLSVRDWLAGESYEYQYEFGLGILRNFGVIQ